MGVQVKKVASLHEHTVKDAANHAAVFNNRRRYSPKLVTKVVRIKPHPLVWKAAISLAKGDVSRLEVRNHETVIVHNKGWRK